jgi:hypothetical protein
MVLRLKKLAARSGSSAALHCTALHCTALHCTALHCTALHCFIGQILLSVLSGNTYVLPTLIRAERHARSLTSPFYSSLLGKKTVGPT